MRKQTKIAALVSAAALLAIGASMTSFADWVGPDANGDYEYLDSDGVAITDEWRYSRSSRDGNYYYYYLGSDGKMVTDSLVESGEHLYYVNANGEKATDYWYQVPNNENLELNGTTPTYLYYYFNDKGQALTGGRKEAYKSNTDHQNKSYFYFDEEGHMLSGWIGLGTDTTYYCSGEDEGYMLTGWQELKVPEEVVDNGEPVNPDSENAWYYFSTSDGKMYKNTRSYLAMSNTNSKKTWFEFDADGCLLENKWGLLEKGTSSDGTKGYYYGEDGYAANGWVKADFDNEDGDDTDNHSSTWFYFTNGKAFNYNGTDAPTASPYNATKIDLWNEDDDGFEAVEDDATKYAARVINGKTYLFNSYGEYVAGVYRIKDGSVYRKGSSIDLTPGIYYFDLANDKEGSMKTNKQTVTNQYEESRNYLFESTGKAVTNKIKNGVLYDSLGRRVDAEEGNWQIVTITSSGTITSDKNVVGKDSPKDENGKYMFKQGDRIVVSASGRVKESGTVTIDGTKYYIKSAPAGTKDTGYNSDLAKDGKLEKPISREAYVIVHQYVVD